MLPCIQASADIANLTLLTSVTQLKIGGWDLPARTLTSALVKMNQLVDLHVCGVDYFGACGLAALTELTGLQHLVVEAKEEQELLDRHDFVPLSSRASPPDVWSQLRQLCLQDRRGAAALAGNLQESSSWEDSSEESDEADDGSSM